MFALVMQAGGNAGLTWKQVLQDIPHDAGAIIVYLLIVGIGFVMWYGNRKDVIKRYGGGSPEAQPGGETSAGDRSSSGPASKAS